MGSKTISLEDSAYEKLKSAKKPGESFSEAIHRLLEGREPSFLDFVGILDRKTAEGVAEVIAQMREEDLRILKRRLARSR